MTKLPSEIYECCKQWKSLCLTTPINELREKIDFSITRNDKTLQGYVRAAENDSKEMFFIICLGNDGQSLINSRKMEKYNLTRREIDIVHLVSTGMTNPEMAKKLFISTRTIQNHLRSIFAKVGVHNRTSLISTLAKE
ncbi:MAG: hypothetical protein GKR93_00190 [Gammaproteobacteria bacterium]|nr:hypothetical protein [Gammaproteobacteria bacterium]